MANKYVECELVVSVSGNSITAYARYRRTYSSTYNYYDPSFAAPTMTIAGTNYTDTAFKTRQDKSPGITLTYPGWAETTHFTKSGLSNGTYTVRWKAGTSYTAPWEADITKTVTINYGSAPSSLSVSVTNATWNSVTANTKVGNWGSGTSFYRELKVLNQNYTGGQGAYQVTSSSNSTGNVALTVKQGDNPTSSPNFSIIGCMPLHTGLYAKNNIGEARLNGPTFYTAPYKLASLTAHTIIVQSDGSYNANVTATTSSTNNYASGNIGFNYRLSTDNGSSYGSWTNVNTTVKPGGAVTLLMSNLQPGKKCVVQVRQFCADAPTVYYSEVQSVSFSTPSVSKPTLTYSWNDVRDTLTVKASVDSTANAGIEIYWGYNSSVSSSLVSTSSGYTTATGTIKYPNHGSGQVIYLMARVYIGSKSNYLETSKVSLPVPNPILGVATTTSGKQYIVDIVEKKSDGSITPKWQNGQRIVKK